MSSEDGRRVIRFSPAGAKGRYGSPTTAGGRGLGGDENEPSRFLLPSMEGGGGGDVTWTNEHPRRRFFTHRVRVPDRRSCMNPLGRRRRR